MHLIDLALAFEIDEQFFFGDYPKQQNISTIHSNEDLKTCVPKLEI